MEHKEENPWKTIKITKVYENPWITVTHEDVIIPSGKNGIYGKVHFKNYAVGIIPLDEENNTWLVGQYRYTIGAYSWEIPEGGALIPQEPLEAAKKELAEEVGLSAKNWELIAKLQNSNSVTDEIAYIFVARELSEFYMEADETEVLKKKKVSLNEAVEMAISGEITDSMSVAGLLKLYHLENLKRK